MVRKQKQHGPNVLPAIEEDGSVSENEDDGPLVDDVSGREEVVGRRVVSLRLDVPGGEGELVDDSGVVGSGSLVEDGSSGVVVGSLTVELLGVSGVVVGSTGGSELELSVGSGFVVVVELSPSARFASRTIDVARAASSSWTASTASCSEGQTPFWNFSGKYRWRRSLRDDGEADFSRSENLDESAEASGLL